MYKIIILGSNWILTNKTYNNINLAFIKELMLLNILTRFV